MSGRHAATSKGRHLAPPPRALRTGEAPRPYIPQYQRLTYLIRLQQMVEVMEVTAALGWIDGYAVLTVTPVGSPGRRVTVECVYQEGVGAWWFRDAAAKATIGTVNDLVMVAHSVRNLVLWAPTAEQGARAELREAVAEQVNVHRVAAGGADLARDAGPYGD